MNKIASWSMEVCYEEAEKLMEFWCALASSHAQTTFHQVGGLGMQLDDL